MFCAGHMLLSNGQGIAAGGTTDYSPWKGSKALYTFDFGTETFIRQKDMSDGRWYPTVVNTRGGYALIVGGFNSSGANSKTSEVWNPWTGRMMRSRETVSSRCIPIFSSPLMQSTSLRVRAGSRLLKTSTALLSSSTQDLAAIRRQQVHESQRFDRSHSPWLWELMLAGQHSQAAAHGDGWRLAGHVVNERNRS